MPVGIIAVSAVTAPIDDIKRIVIVIRIRRPIIIPRSITGPKPAPVPPRGIPGIIPVSVVSPPIMRMERVPPGGILPPMGRRPERIEIIGIKPGVVVVIEIVDARVPVFFDGHGLVGLVIRDFFGFSGGLPGNHDHGITPHACEHDDPDHAGKQRGFHGFHFLFLSKDEKTRLSILFYSVKTIGFHS
jgi:hypothetical protein